MSKDLSGINCLNVALRIRESVDLRKTKGDRWSAWYIDGRPTIFIAGHDVLQYYLEKKYSRPNSPLEKLSLKDSLQEKVVFQGEDGKIAYQIHR